MSVHAAVGTHGSGETWENVRVGTQTGKQLWHNTEGESHRCADTKLWAHKEAGTSDRNISVWEHMCAGHIGSKTRRCGDSLENAQ